MAAPNQFTMLSHKQQENTPVYLALYLSLYGGLCLLARVTGYQMVVPFHYFQFLDVAPLQTSLAESLWYLHAQPPLPNLWLGLALKLADAGGPSVASSLLGLQLAMGAVVVVGLYLLALSLLPGRWLPHLFILFWLLNPVFYSNLFIYFYPIHELFWLVVVLGSSWHYLQRGTMVGWMLTAMGLVGLVYSRSLFHPFWAIAFMVGLFWLASRRHTTKRTAGNWLLLGITAVSLLLWPLKNQYLFGFFGYSSWQGYNMAQGLLVDRTSITAVFTTAPAQAVPAAWQSVPVLAQPQKSDGSDNWNYYPIIPYAQSLQAEVTAQTKVQPAIWWDKIRQNYRYGYGLHAGRNTYEGGFDLRSTNTPFHYWWMRLHEIIFFQYIGEDVRVDHRTGFFFTFPFIMLLSLIQAWYRRNYDPEVSSFVLLTSSIILWVLLLILLVDGMEGNRIRFSTEPFIWLLAFWGITTVLSTPK